MFTQNRIIRQFTLRTLLFTCCLFFSVALTPPSGAQSSCDEALPLPLDHSIHGHVPERGPGIYRLEVPHRGWLTVEAHDLGPKPGPVNVTLLDGDCQALAAASERRMPSRASEAVDHGDYYLEVRADEPLDAGIQLYAWLAPAVGVPPSLLTAQAGTTDGSGSGSGSGDTGPHEPIDEWDERAGWCPWSGRLELLATFTCARQIQLGADHSATVEPLRLGGREMLELRTTQAGWLQVDLSGVTILDHRGTFVGWSFPGHPVALPAGRWYLRWPGETGLLTVTWQ